MSQDTLADPIPDPVPGPIPELITPPAFGGFWRRVAASLLDSLLMLLFLVVVSLPNGLSPLLDDDPASVQDPLGANLLAFVLQWLYFAGLHSSALQATPGKLALGIKVVDWQGERLSFGRATGRYFATVLSSLPLLAGFVAAGLARDKRSLHDVVAGTMVVRRGVLPAQVVAHRSSRRWPRWAIVLLVMNPVAIGALITLAMRAEPPQRAANEEVIEGLREAEAYKRKVAAAIGRGEPVPVEVNLEPQSRFLESVEIIEDGVVILVFGGEASAELAQRQLMIHAARSPGSRRVVWVCGYAEVPAGFSIGRDDHYEFSDVPAEFLPAHCR